MLYALVLSCLIAWPPADPIAEALARPILSSGQTLAEVQHFVATRIPLMTEVRDAREWAERATAYRDDVLSRVIFRGEAARWRSLPTRPEWLGTIDGGPGYRIKKLRFEAVPGLWVPALLYEPTDLRGPAPVVLNVNGHDPDGKAAASKQLRCINLAKNGMIALNLEWIGMGQLAGKANDHGLLNAIDLCGTGGIAVHYLAMTRGLDILLGLPHADPDRVGVTGLSGGGWQTIFVSALDMRVTLSDPVAGYSSFRTRVRYLEDLGDSEQTPCDLATIVDYTHLTAMMAPRPTLLTFNANDDCCFAAPHALPPLLDAARPVFALFGAEGNLRSHVNLDPGNHNYGLDNRQSLYQMMSDQWSRASAVINPREVASESEIKTAEELAVPLPTANLGLRDLARDLAETLPRRDRPRDRPFLKSLVKPIAGSVTVQVVAESEDQGREVVQGTLKIGTSWTIPFVEITPKDATETVILIGDEGRKALAHPAETWLGAGKRVVAVDLYGFGEAVPPSHGYLFSLAVGTVGERPLGLDCGQLLAVARWWKDRDGKAPTLVADGPRSSLIAMVVAALGPNDVKGLVLHRPLASLKDSITEGRTFEESPEVFCFGLLEWFDVRDLASLIAPRPILLNDADDRARAAINNR